MGYFYNYKNNLVGVLSKYFKNIKIDNEFTPDKRMYPLKENLICLSYKNIKNNYNAMGYMGENENGEIFNANATMTLILDIYVPTSKGGSYCYYIFSKLADFFILNNGIYKGENFKGNEVRFESLIEAFNLKAEIDIKTNITYTNDENGFIKEIIIKNGGQN